jgi:uncharacterized protein (DUF58 family)
VVGSPLSLTLPVAIARVIRRLPKPRPLRSLPLFGGPIRAFQDRLTPRGRYLFVTVVAFALLGLDTRARQVYVLFSLAAGLYVTATIFGFRPRPRVELSCRIPDRATVGTPVRFTAVLSGDGTPISDLFLAWPPLRDPPARLEMVPRETFVAIGDDAARVPFTLTAARRGRYVVGGARLRGTDPLGLVTTLPVAIEDSVLLVYPRYYRLDGFDIPLGRRYQPGGIPLTSSTGDAIEFIGTRDYRPGDPLRNIHWRSWARRGEPVVKEYQEEYFCRIAIVLDTFLRKDASDEERAAFEATISVVASIADHFSRSEYVVDILAAGPDLYEVSAGRSLAYLDNILDVLACLEPCYDPPFQTIGPHLFERLSQLTTVVTVLQDWDAEREGFLRRVRASGVAVRGIIVHDGPTSVDWRSAADDLGRLELMSPAQVADRVAESATS